MSLSRNLLAGLASSIWSALLGLAVVPFYLKYLGHEAYGLIGFFVTMQALIQFLDMGMASTINREVSRGFVSGDLKETSRLLHTLAVVYWIVAAAISVLILILAPFIAEYWLQSKQFSQKTISQAVMLMGLVIACRWPLGLYQGVLIGAQRLSVSSRINIVMATISSLGAVAIIALASPSIETFFVWQACSGLTHTLIMRAAAWRVVGKEKNNYFDLFNLKSVWRFTAGMSGIGLSALIFTQLDKVILSKMLSLTDFGAYMLATAVVSGLYIFVAPLYNIIYPRFSALVATGEIEKLTYFYRLGTQLISATLFPLAMLLAIFSKDFVVLWTNNVELASKSAPVISLLAIGSALHGVMHFPYALQLAYGMTRLPLMINIILMIFLTPLIIFFSKTYGALGGALAWLILHGFYLFLGSWLTHRHLLKGIGVQWLLRDVGFSLSLSLLVGTVGYCLIKNTEFSIFLRLFSGAVMALVAFFISILGSSELKKFLMLRLKL